MRCLIVFVFLALVLSGCATSREAAGKKGAVERKIQRQQVVFAPDPAVIGQTGIDAYSIYASSQKPSVSGVYECKNFVFVIVVIDYAKQHFTSPEASAMLRTAAMLRQKYNLPEDFNLSCSIIENEDDEENSLYHRVAVFYLDEVRQLASHPVIATAPKAAPQKRFYPKPAPKKRVAKGVSEKEIKVKNIQKKHPVPHSTPSGRTGTFSGDRNISDDF